MILYSECDYFNENRDSEYAPPYGKCEECYRYDICRKAKLLNALKLCSEFYCDECPYKSLDHETYKLKCIHTLIKDAYELFKEQ